MEKQTEAAVFAGIWMSRNRPLAYRVLPKCGCSSIGQTIHYIDHAKFYKGNIHDSEAEILKFTGMSSAVEIKRKFDQEPIVSFTFARNPFRRLLSAYAEKIFGYQYQDGKRYMDGHLHNILQSYGVYWGPKSSILHNFKKFVSFATDTVENRQPLAPDWHWTPMIDHLKYTALGIPGWNLDFIGHVEHFRRDLEDVLCIAGVPPDRRPEEVPRENTTSLPDFPISKWFGEKEIEAVRRAYAEDFRVFGYGPDPEHPEPLGRADPEAVNAALRSRRV